MSDCWPTVRLAEVIRHRKEFVTIDDMRQYKRCRVQLHAKGVVLRDAVPGAEIKTKSQQVCRAGEFLVAEIDAKVGGFGMVPDDLNGAIVSSHYFLFVVEETRLDRSFLDYYARTQAFRDQVGARGSTNYAAIRPAHVLEYTIPLPPLAEQQRIVAKIDHLAGKIAEARDLRRTNSETAVTLERSMIDSAYRRLIKAHGTSPLASSCDSISDGDHLTPKFAENGVRFIFVGNVSSGSLHFEGCKYVSREYFDRIKPLRKPVRGDVLFTAVGATLGIPAVVDVDEKFCFQRHVAIIKPNRHTLFPQFLWYMLRSSTLFQLAWASTTGSAQPTIPLRGIKVMPVPVPPLAEQRRIVTYLDGLQSKVHRLKELQAKTAAELDALLPSILDKAFKGEL